MMTVGFGFRRRTCCAIAVTAKRTLANVNSSAMSARHPDVPNMTPGLQEDFPSGLPPNFVEAVVIARYCSVRRTGQPVGCRVARQSVNA